MYDRPVDRGETLDDDGAQLLLEELQLVVHGGLAGDAGGDGQDRRGDDGAVLGLHLHKLGRAKGVPDALSVYLVDERAK